MKKINARYIIITVISLILLGLWFVGLLNPYVWIYPQSNTCGDLNYTGETDTFVTCHAVGCPIQETPLDCPIDYLFGEK